MGGSPSSALESNEITYYVLAENITDLSYTQTLGILPGGIYNYIVYARNIIGLGRASDPLMIVAASIPSTPKFLTRNDAQTNQT
jgi:hypothetical protein